MTATVAIDIETVSPHLDDAEQVDFLDSRDFQVAAIGVGHRAAPRGDIETDVIWRPGADTGDEYQALAELCDWLNERIYDEIVTYNGVRFDFRHLIGRAAIVGSEVGDPSISPVLHRKLDTATHRDLMHDIQRNHGHRMTLEDAVEEYCGDRPPAIQWEGDVIENGDIPDLAQRWLAHRSGLVDLGEEAPQLRDALESYIHADIEPLFRLADALDDAGRE